MRSDAHGDPVHPWDLSSVCEAPPRGASFLANSYGLERGDPPRSMSLPSSILLG